MEVMTTSVNLREELERTVPTGLKPLTGFDGGLQWTTPSGHNRYAVITPGGEYLLEFATRKTSAPELAAAVCRFATEHWQQLIGTASPIRVVHGFRPAPPYSFDCVAALAPDIHNAHKVEYPALHSRTFSLAVVHSWEVLPSLSEAEAIATKKLVALSNLERPVNPLVRTKFRAGSARSTGDRRAVASERNIVPVIARLDSDPNGFIELENARGDLATLQWLNGYVANETGQAPQSLGSREAATDWLRSFLRRQVNGPATRPGGEPGLSGVNLAPTITLSLEDGTVADGLSDWQLRDELDRLSPSGSNRFAVFQHEPQRYLQTYANEDGTFDLEYRDGGPDQHYRSAQPVSPTEMKAAFVSYGLEGDESWRDQVAWENAPRASS